MGDAYGLQSDGGGAACAAGPASLTHRKPNARKHPRLAAAPITVVAVSPEAREAFTAFFEKRAPVFPRG